MIYYALLILRMEIKAAMRIIHTVNHMQRKVITITIATIIDLLLHLKPR
jgi:hypothetical protein